MNENYKCPEWIINKFTKEIMLEFKVKLCDVFSKSLDGSTELTQFYIDGISSTYGWSDAFKYICNKFNLQDVLEYQDKLDWYDWDIFVDDINNLLFDFGIVRRVTDEEYLEYYGNHEEE